MASTFATQSFGLLVVGSYAVLLLWLARVGRMHPGPGIGAGVVLAAWLSLTAAQAPASEPATGDAVFVLTGLAVFGAVAAALSRPVRQVLDRTSPGWLIAFQAVRFGLALVLWRLAAEGLWPNRVAAFGMSLDVVTGALAPLVAWLAYKERTLSSRWVLAFHGLGLTLLAVVLGETLLAASSFLTPAPATTPFIWLPTFVLPLALFAHVASIRQVVRERRLSYDEDVARA